MIVRIGSAFYYHLLSFKSCVFQFIAKKEQICYNDLEVLFFTTLKYHDRNLGDTDNRCLIMKRIKSSIVIIVLSFIVLFIGMCSEIERTDSFVLYSKQASEIETIEQVKSDSLYIGNCTNKLITGLRDTFQRSRRGTGRLSLRSYAEFVWIKEVLQMLVFLSIAVAVVCPIIQINSTAILEFIHNQDGEK